MDTAYSSSAVASRLAALRHGSQADENPTHNGNHDVS